MGANEGGTGRPPPSQPKVRVRPQPHTEHGANIRGPVESGGYRQPYQSQGRTRYSPSPGAYPSYAGSAGPQKPVPLSRGYRAKGPSGRTVYHTREAWKAIQAKPTPTPKFGAGLTAAQQGLLNSLLSSKPKPSLGSAHSALSYYSHVNGGKVPGDFFKSLAKQYPELKSKNPNDPNALYSVSEPALKHITAEATKAGHQTSGFSPASLGKSILSAATSPQKAQQAGAAIGTGLKVGKGLAQQEAQALQLRPRNVAKTKYSGLESVPGDVLGAVKKAPGEIGSLLKQSQIVGFGNQPAPLRPLTTGGQNPPGKSKVLGTAEGKQSSLAPGLQVLNLSTTPIHALAGAETEAIKHGPNAAVGGFVKGLKGKQYGTQDVLGAAGVPHGTLRTILGTAGDIFLDPTTYVGFGLNVPRKVVMEAAQAAAKDAAEKAASRGLPAHVVEQAGRMAGERVVRRAGGTSKRTAVSFAGHEVPGSTTAAKAVARPIKAVLRPAAKSKPGVAVRTGTRNVISDVSPRTAPAGIPKAGFQGARTAARQARGVQRDAVRVADARVAAAKRLIPPQHFSAVQDALERADLSGLPRELVAPRVVKGQTVPGPAVQLRDAYRGLDRARSQAGIPGGSITPRTRAINIRKATAAVEQARAAEEHPATIAALERKVQAAKAAPKGYTAHIAVRDEEAPPVGGVGSGKPRPPATKSRASGLNVPLATLRETHPGAYHENPALGIGQRTAEGGAGVAKARLNQRLMGAIGRPLPRPKAPLGSHVPRATTEARPFQLQPGETIYRLKGSDLQELKPSQLASLLEKPGPGQLFAADKSAVDHMRAPFLHGERKGIGRAYDALQSGFKRTATFTPGFNIRNLIGDTQMGAFNPQGGGVKFFKSYPKAVKSVKALSKHEAAARKGGGIGRIAPPVKPGEKPTAAQYADEALRQGVPRSGYVGREIQDLSRPGREMDAAAAEAGKKVKVKTRPISSRYNRWSANREDVARQATYITARERGLTPEQAANEVADTHIDYGDLSEIERKVFRRIAPFYTFSARNIPFEARTLLQKPGRVAALQKIRENVGQDNNLPPGYEKLLQEYEQRQLGIPIGGHNVSASLPAMDLNELPVSANPGKLLNEWWNRAMQLPSPFLKDPIELATNFSFFFRRAIENDKSPLVAAPSWVQYLPDGLKKAAHVVGPNDPHPFRDPRTGKPTWGWRGKADYIAGQLEPGLLQLFKQIGTSTDRGGQSGVGKFGVLTGLRSTPLSKATFGKTKLNQAYQQQTDLQNRQSELNQRGVSAANSTAEYRQNAAKLKKLVNETIPGLRTQTGLKVKVKSPPRARRSAGGYKAVGGGGGYKAVR